MGVNITETHEVNTTVIIIQENKKKKKKNGRFSKHCVEQRKLLNN